MQVNSGACVKSGGANNFVGVDLGGFDCLELVSVSGLADARLLKGCGQVYELLLWNTDVGKLDLNWLADCDNLRLLEFVECSGFENCKQKAMPAFEFLRIVKPSRKFILSAFFKIFPSVRTLDLQGIRMSQIDCEVHPSVELFVVNGKILKNVQ